MSQKIYKKLLNDWSYRRIVAAKSQGADNFRLAVRSGLEQYILSNPASSKITMNAFKMFEQTLEARKEIKMPITISFIRKFGKMWIANIN